MIADDHLSYNAILRDYTARVTILFLGTTRLFERTRSKPILDCDAAFFQFLAQSR